MIYVLKQQEIQYQGLVTQYSQNDYFWPKLIGLKGLNKTETF